MSSLTDIYNDISLHDAAYLEKQAAQLQKTAELEKQAEEEDAAGRITARGFADELNKLAGLRSMVSKAVAGAKGAGGKAVSKAKSMGAKAKAGAQGRMTKEQLKYFGKNRAVQGAAAGGALGAVSGASSQDGSALKRGLMGAAAGAGAGHYGPAALRKMKAGQSSGKQGQKLLKN